MISIGLVGVKKPENIGAVARSMKNFDLGRLFLINPRCSHLDKKAMDLASHAKDVLKKAKVVDFDYVNRFSTIIGTTAIIGTDYNLRRSPLPINKLKIKGGTIILFGREDDGLHNNELKKCDFIVTVQASKKYPTLNIAHAASIVFYELFTKNKIEYHKTATQKDKESFMNLLNKTLDRMRFSTEQKKETQRIIWRRMIGKAQLSKRELFGLFGFLKKVK
jgi:tRNA/rRNA methyltransferase